MIRTYGLPETVGFHHPEQVIEACHQIGPFFVDELGQTFRQRYGAHEKVGEVHVERTAVRTVPREQEAQRQLQCGSADGTNTGRG